MFFDLLIPFAVVAIATIVFGTIWCKIMKIERKARQDAQVDVED